MKITVIGAGAMGCLFGAKLSKNRNVEVLLVDTWKEHVDKLNTSGLELRSGSNSEHFTVNAVLPSESMEPADLVIVFTKSGQTTAALEGVQTIFSKHTTALTLQNGLGNVEKLGEYLPLEQIVVGVTTIPSDMVAQGVVRSEGEGTCKILSADGIKRPETDAVADLFNKAGLNCLVVEDVFVSIWEKVAFNAAMNALCAVTRLSVGEVGDTEEGQRLAMSIAEETIAIANHKGIQANLERCKSMIQDAFAQHKSHQPSMLQDIKAKRMTEIDAINGAIAAEAQRFNLQAPVTETLANLVHIIQANYPPD